MKIKEVRNNLILEAAPHKSFLLLYNSAIDYFKRELGISTNIKVKYKGDINKPSKSNKFGYYDFNSTIEIENSTPIIIIGRLAHEFTHVKQKENNELTIKNKILYWEGEEIVSLSEYMKNNNFDIHKNWPWEVEAYSNQKLLPQKYYKSAEFIKTMNSDPTLKYMLDNNLIP